MSGVHHRQCCCDEGTPACTCENITSCALCATCAPVEIEITFSGISTTCYLVAGTGNREDVAGATLSGTVIATGGAFDSTGTGSCTWVKFYAAADPDVGKPFNVRTYSGATPTGASTCSGTLLDEYGDCIFTVILDRTAIGPDVIYLQVDIGGGGAGVYFSARQLFSLPRSCLTTYTLNNGDGGMTTFGGSGGSVTITFCPNG